MGSAGGEVNWSLERCCRGTSPAVPSGVPGSQPQQHDRVNLEVWGSILSLFSSASPFLPPCSLPPLDDVTAPCCQGLCMHVTCCAQFAPIRRRYSTVPSGVVHACYVLCSVCPYQTVLQDCAVGSCACMLNIWLNFRHSMVQDGSHLCLLLHIIMFSCPFV